MGMRTPTCPQCGKQFTVPYPAKWAYRDKTVYFCSWKCIRAHDAGLAPTKDGVQKVPTDALTDAQMAGFRERDARAKKQAMRPVITPKEPVRKRRTDEEIRQKLLEYKSLREQGRSYREAALEVGVPYSTLDKYLRIWAEELGIHRATNQERALAGCKARGVYDNHSREKTARISAALHRMNAIMADLNEEVRAYAGR